MQSDEGKKAGWTAATGVRHSQNRRLIQSRFRNPELDVSIHYDNRSTHYASPAFVATAEAEAARAAAEDQDGEAEEFFAQPEETREEQENLKMLAHDDRWLMHLAEEWRQPSPWLIWALREGERSCLEELD